MATDSQRIEEVQKQNQDLKKQVSDLMTELKDLKDEIKSYHKKLKKVEYEKENAESHVINLKRDLDSLRKELYDEKRKWKQEKEELSKACQRKEYSILSEQQQSSTLNSNLNSDETDSKDIKAVLEEAASQAMSKSGFVYDERTGLYYDWNSGLYYDPNSCLYYNNQTGTYYFYNEANKSYEFHSQVELPLEDNKDNSNDQQDKYSKKKKKSKSSKPTVIEVKSSSDEECSSGEIISTDDDDDDDDDSDDDSRNEENVHKVAPCIRAIVTDSDKLKIGTLFIITCTGGTLGREKDVGHGIRIPDVSISKCHCRISYDQERRQYFINDLASRNGSFLNGQRLGQSNEESQPCVLTHDDRLMVGGTTLAIHIHQGNETCDNCEPGLVQAKLPVTQNDEVSDSHITQGNLTSEDKRKKLLKTLKKAYGLEKEAYEDELEVPNKRKYRDRAELRRVKVGSDVPVELPDAPPASVHRPISSDNKGRKMLEKMGWKDGEGLGKEGSGRLEPVNAGIHDKLRGLGSGTLRSLDSGNTAPSASSVIRSKARKRYQKMVASDGQKSDTPIHSQSTDTVFVPQTKKQ